MSLHSSPESQSDPDNFPVPFSTPAPFSTPGSDAPDGAANDKATPQHQGVAETEPRAASPDADAAHEVRPPIVPSVPLGARVARDSLTAATTSASEAAATAAAFRKNDDFTADDLVAGAFDEDAPEEATTDEDTSAAEPLADDGFNNNRVSAFHDAFDSGPDDVSTNSAAMTSNAGGYGGPPVTAYGADSAFVPDPIPYPAPDAAAEKAARDKEQDLFEHLGELRKRLLSCIVAIGIVMVGTWNWRDALLAWFSAPIGQEVHKKGGTLITLNPAEGFTLYLQITFIAALLIAMPIVLYQIWAFIEPALTHQERRYGVILVPFAVVLFFSGAGLGFYLTPLFFKFFLQFQPPGSVANWSYGAAATMLAKMLLVFGICFQVPVVTVFINKIGLVSRNWLIEYWRHVVVVIFTVVAIITPTWDPVTLTAAALPPCLLYGFSIWLVKWL